MFTLGCSFTTFFCQGVGGARRLCGDRLNRLCGVLRKLYGGWVEKLKNKAYLSQARASLQGLSLAIKL